MGDNGNGEKSVMVKWLLGIFASAILALSSFTLFWQFNANAQIEVLKIQLDEVKKKKDADVKQDHQIQKFWKLHSWEKTRIDELRIRQKLPLSEWPDLNAHEEENH